MFFSRPTFLAGAAVFLFTTAAAAPLPADQTGANVAQHNPVLEARDADTGSVLYERTGPDEGSGHKGTAGTNKEPAGYHQFTIELWSDAKKLHPEHATYADMMIALHQKLIDAAALKVEQTHQTQSKDMVSRKASEKSLRDAASLQQHHPDRPPSRSPPRSG